MKKIIQGLAASAAVVAVFLAASVGFASYFTPDSFQVAAGRQLNWNMDAVSLQTDQKEISVNAAMQPEQSYTAKLMLYHVVPIKTVNVNVISDTMLIPCGTPFGIKMFTNGVVIVGTADIQTADGSKNPAGESGLRIGDVITAIDGKKVTTNAEVGKIIAGGNGRPVMLSVKREEKELTVSLQPAKSEIDSTYKAGLWVRDSTAGIGTLTFYNPAAKTYGGLGHGVCDSDTNEIMPLLNGEIVPVTINGITKGRKGAPGELKGYFSTDASIGTLDLNVLQGVYGVMGTAPKGQAVEVSMKQDIKAGAAQIMTTIDGSGPQRFDVEIEKIDYRDEVQTKNMVLHVTDEKLLNATGGIVQGMSGSPILQDGKIVGAVTHVFVNDPTRGYGIFAENMLEVSQRMKVQAKAS